MINGRNVSTPAALFGHPTRVALLTELLGGVPLTSGSLAVRVGVSPSSASIHFGHLADGGLVTVSPSGRQRLYTLASAEVARAIETLATLRPDHRQRPSIEHVRLRLARVL